MPDPQVSKIGLHLPKFENSYPELWFAIAEQSFLAAGITTEQTKFAHAVANIGLSAGSENKDLILCPATDNPYTHLKNELIKRLGTSQTTKLRKLLEGEVLGDQKPSQFLRKLKDLGGNAISDDIIRTLWINRLPAMIQAILSSQQNVPLENLANIADSIMETTQHTPLHLNEIKPNPVEHTAPVDNILITTLQQLTLQISSLQGRIKQLETSRPNSSSFRRRSRSSSRRRSQKFSPHRNTPPFDTCWYHWKFGPKASKCIKPCNFQPKPGN